MRILFVGMANSIHLVRWIRQFDGLGWDIHLFPVDAADPHPSLSNVTVHDTRRNRAMDSGSSRSVRLRDELWPLLGMNWPISRGAGRIMHLLGRWFPWEDRAWRLARTIQKIQPDVIHSHEFQHAAYLTLDARELLQGRFPPWIVSNWGSDIYLFSRLRAHRERIKAVLAACNYYTCECSRDVKLAKDLGLGGEVLGVVPNTGGFDIAGARSLRQPGPTSARRTIALKGYQHLFGRSLFGLRGIELAADALKDYRIAVFSATEDMRIAVELLADASGLQIECLDHCSNEDILRLHGMARVSIGIGISDAASISMLEGMIMGSFPIQSNTSCANEWIKCGESGFLVPPEDPQAVAEAIRRAVTDDALVDRAAEINACTVMERLDQSVIRPKVIAMYDRVAADRARERQED